VNDRGGYAESPNKNVSPENNILLSVIAVSYKSDLLKIRERNLVYHSIHF